MLKLCGNVPYGKSISSLEKYSSVRFVNKERAQQAVTQFGYQHLTELTTDLYELDLQKRTISYNLPTCFGVCVYGNAKLKMLKYVDFIRDSLCPERTILAYCDTDSLFVGSASLDMEKCVLPEMLGGSGMHGSIRLVEAL